MVPPKRTTTAPSACLATLPVSSESGLPLSLICTVWLVMKVSFSSHMAWEQPSKRRRPARRRQQAVPGLIRGCGWRGWCGPGSSGPSKCETGRSPRSLADSELVRQDSVSLRVLLPEVFQEAAAPADEHEQAAAGVVVFLVGLEVIGQAVDPLGEKRDLHFRRARVAVVRLELLDETLLLVDGQPHAKLLPGVPPPIAAFPGPLSQLRWNGFV